MIHISLVGGMGCLTAVMINDDLERLAWLIKMGDGWSVHV